MNRFAKTKVLCASLAGACLLLLGCEVPNLSSSSGDIGTARATFTGYIYVSPAPTGNNTTGDGTSAKPYATLAKAASVATSGKTIKLASGTFTETTTSAIPLGVSIEGAGVSSTIITSSSLTATGAEAESGFLIRLTSGGISNGDQTLSGFKIDGRSRAFNGLFVNNRNNVTINNVNFINCHSSGARVFSTNYSSVYMTGIVISNCSFTNCSRDFDYNSNGAYDSGDFSSGNLNIGGLDGANIYNITVSENQGYGIKFTNNGFFKNLRLHDCTISVSESDALWGEDIAIELWDMGPGNQVYNINCNTWLSMVNHPGNFASPASAGENLKLYNIKIVDNNASSGKEAIELAVPGAEVYNSFFQNKGFGIAVWDAGGYQVSVHNNVFYNSAVQSSWASGGVYVDNSTGRTYSNIKVLNNVFDTYSTAVTTKVSSGSITNVDIKNNAFLNVTTKDLSAQGSNIVFQNNLKGSGSFSVTGATTNSGNIVGAPGYNNSGARDSNYYKPSSASSFAVNKGLNVGLPYSGTAPDIGYFEYPISGGTTTTTTTTTVAGGTYTRYEAETATLLGNATVASDHSGYSGSGFAAGFWGSTTAGVQWSLSGQTAGTKTLRIKYAAGNGASTHLGLFVNNTRIRALSLPATTNWDTWATKTESISLSSGSNTIKIVCESSSTACENLDYIEVSN